jgi:7-cyano-7-deazaguanine reductase
MIETLPNRYAARPFLVELVHGEFTSISPLTGAPDFGSLTIRYVPLDNLLELRSVGEYLTGFRDRRILQEEVVNVVLDDIVVAAQPYWVEIEGRFNARDGSLTMRAVARSGEDPTQ